MARPITVSSVEKNVIANMKSLRTYRDEFKPIISIYARLLYQYHRYSLELEENDFVIAEEYTNKAGATNFRKTPLATAMESLRKDILSYSDRLMLNPKALGEVVSDDGVSPLQELFKKLGNK